MRAYLPLANSELLSDSPPTRTVMVASVPEGVAGEEREAAFEEVLDDAAFASLQVVQELEAAGGRVVAVGELDSGSPSFSSWKQIDSLMVDGPAAVELVQRILVTADESLANELVEQLFELPLEWFDISERQTLGVP